MKNYLYFIIALFLTQGEQLMGQGFEKIYQGSSPSIIQLSDSNLLCLSSDRLYNLNSITGQQNWSQPANGCFSKLVKGTEFSNYCLGISNCTISPGPFPNNIIHKIDNYGDTIWTKTLGPTANYPLGMYANNSLYFGCYTGQNSYLLKLDSLGNILDSVYFGNYIIKAITFKNQETYIALHKSQNDSVKIITLDSNLIESNSLGIDSIPYYVSNLEKTDTGFIMLAGKHLYAIDQSTGVKLMTFNFSSSSYYYGFTLMNDSTLALTGRNNDDARVTIFDLQNNSIINSQNYGSFRYTDFGVRISLLFDNDLLISGATEYKDGNRKAYVFRIGPDLTLTNCSDSLEIINTQFSCLGDTVQFLNNSFGLGKWFTWEVMGDTFNNYTVNQPFYFYADSVGVFEVKLISCYDTISTSIIINDTLIPSFTFDSYGDSIVFNSPSGYGNLVYNWDFGDGTYSYDSIVYHIYQDTGDYVVTLNFHSGYCYSNQSKIISIYNSLDMKETAINKTVKIFPNPSSNGVFQIESNIQNQKLQVYNYSGMTIPFHFDENQIKIINPVSGIYYLKITTILGETSLQKLIIY